MRLFFLHVNKIPGGINTGLDRIPSCDPAYTTFPRNENQTYIVISFVIYFILPLMANFKPT